MAKPKTLKFGMLKIELGDGGSPEVFSAPCGLTQKAFNRTKNLTEVNVPDCDDPDAPTEVERDITSTDWSITGQGVLAGEAVATWDDAYASADSISIKITEVWPAPIGTIAYTGKAHLATYEVSSQSGGRAQVNISLQADGGLTRVPALA